MHHDITPQVTPWSYERESLWKNKFVESGNSHTPERTIGIIRERRNNDATLREVQELQGRFKSIETHKYV